MRFMIRRGLRPGIRPALDLRRDAATYHRRYPFRRSWIAAAIVAAIDVALLIPAVGTFRQAAIGWGRFVDLFDLVSALFLSLWLLGWSIGPLLITSILALMLFGREVITASPGKLRIFVGLPLIGLAADYAVAHMRNLRIEKPETKPGRSWRGAHLVFDYGANPVAVGSDVGEADLTDLTRGIESASGQSVRSGAATPEELEGRWDRETAFADETIASPPAKAGPPLKWSSPSTLALILANLVPVAGAVYLGWNLGTVMVLYWAESAVIGFYNLCKLAVIERWMALLYGTFFIAHFGAFMVVHFLFIWGIFVRGFDDTSGGDLSEVARLFVDLWPALLALFVSHGISFFQNFIGRREYRGRTAKNQMAEPYTRIVLMHVVLIVGGGLSLLLGGPAPVLLLVIAGKICFDVMAHVRQRETGT